MDSEEQPGLDDVQRRELEIVNGAPINHPEKRQFQLAVEWASKKGKKVDSKDKDSVNDALMAWAMTEPNYSAGYRACITGEVFKKHPRIMGNFSKLTLADMDHFMEFGNLPEN